MVFLLKWALVFTLVSPAPVDGEGLERIRFLHGDTGLFLSLGHLKPKRTSLGTVLFIHGATFPSACAAGFSIGNAESAPGYGGPPTSWMAHLAKQGFDVWALDFLGYGESDPYSQMSQPAHEHLPLGRAPEASQQIQSAVDTILQSSGAASISLIAHSWGTLPASLYAGNHGEKIDKLVLFGPVAVRQGGNEPRETLPAWRLITPETQWQRFSGYLPKGELPVFKEAHFQVWRQCYLESDASSATREPQAVLTPSGPVADILDVWSGTEIYKPSLIKAPTLIVFGEWDVVTRLQDAQYIYSQLTSAPFKQLTVLGRGTHVMHLETGRFQLYREVDSFLKMDDSPKL